MKGPFRARAPYARLIAATDGSELAGKAVAGAAQLAKRTNAELYVFHAAGDIVSEAAVARQVAELLTDLPYKLEIRNLMAGTPMSPGLLIGQFAEELGDSLVVVGTHGRSGLGAAFLGSTTAELARRPGRTTLVYGPQSKPPTEMGRVVACVDGTEFSELCLDEAAMWSLALGLPLRVVQVVPSDLPSYVTVFEGAYVDNLSKELEAVGGMSVEGEVLHSESPARAILGAFGADSATMLVMATHGRIGFKRVTMGSVALEVVRGAGGPVALTCPAEPA